MGELVAFMGGIVVLVSFGKLCIKGYQYFSKKFEIDVAVKKRNNRD